MAEKQAAALPNFILFCAFFLTKKNKNKRDARKRNKR
jgi:hypothetical protein